MRRPTHVRVAEVIERLESEENAWIATASPDGRPHLIPLSLAWRDGRIMFVTPTDSPTVRNIEATERARVSLDSADDVAIFAGNASAADLAAQDPSLVDWLATRMGWDPRTSDERWSLVTVEPRLAHAWKGEPEIEGRTVMRRGAWLT